MLRLLKGKAGKSRLFEDLIRGSKSSSTCWIEYGWKINILLPAQIDSWSFERKENTKNDNVKLFTELNQLFSKLYKSIGYRYSDIYLYGNFTEEEIPVLREMEDYLNNSDPDEIAIRLNATIQTDDENITIEIH